LAIHEAWEQSGRVCTTVKPACTSGCGTPLNVRSNEPVARSGGNPRLMVNMTGRDKEERKKAVVEMNRNATQRLGQWTLWPSGRKFTAVLES